jgi:hypothetical protein
MPVPGILTKTFGGKLRQLFAGVVRGISIGVFPWSWILNRPPKQEHP